jgi:hypothetical protein
MVTAARKCGTGHGDGVELGKKIDHYRTICVRISDEKTVEGIRKLIAEMEAQKAALHAVGR